MSDLEPISESRARYHREPVHPPPRPDAAPRIVSGWPEVDAALFDDGRGAAPAFPLELLPLPWRGWVADTAAGAGAPVAYVAQALLAAVAGLCGAGAVVRLAPAWTEPLVLWQALVGRPSSGKSPALAPVRALLATLEEELGEGEAAGKKRPFLLNDGAAEILANALAAAPRGVILWRDQPSGCLAFLDDGARKDRSPGWRPGQAGPVFCAARARSSRHERCPMSVLISIRPDRLVAALEDRRTDGLAARLLYAWPDPPGLRPLAERRPARDEQALDLLRSISRVAGSLADPLVLAPMHPPPKRSTPSSPTCTASCRTPKAWRPTGWARAPAPWRGSPACWRCSPGPEAAWAGRPGRSAARRWRSRSACGRTICGPRPPGVRSRRSHRHRPPGAPRGALAEGESPDRGQPRGRAAPRARPHPRRGPHRWRARPSLRSRRAQAQDARLLRAGRPAGATLGGQPGFAGRRDAGDEK